MTETDLSRLAYSLGQLQSRSSMGWVCGVEGGTIRIEGLSAEAKMGNRVTLSLQDGSLLDGEVVRISGTAIDLLAEGPSDGVAIGDRAVLAPSGRLCPDISWLGRVIDPRGQPLDGRSLLDGPVPRDIRAAPPLAASRRALGARIETGLRVFNTFLPIVRGQRIGLFAGSGVGKSTLLGQLCKGMAADVIVIGLVGERGRELREFVEETLGPDGMKRSVIVAATSDQAPQIRRRCAWTAMAVAEHFRDQGLQVLLLLDSVTRFAEAHREVAVAGGEAASLRGFPASTNHMITALCERAGPGIDGQGDITAVFTVLVAGSDMEEPIADIMRGVLDGHVVLDREIAERGRFPAVDLLRSVSRALPRAATSSENKILLDGRRLLGTYSRAEMMIQAGLYANGSDPQIDQAIRCYPALDMFISETSESGFDEDYSKLQTCLEVRVRHFAPKHPQSEVVRVRQEKKFSVEETAD